MTRSRDHRLWIFRFEFLIQALELVRPGKDSRGGHLGGDCMYLSKYLSCFAIDKQMFDR